MMKKYSFLALNLLMILGICISQVHAGRGHIQSFLEREVKEFDRAPTAEARFAVALRPFNLNYLQELPDGQTIDPQELRAHVSLNVFDNGEGSINCDKSNLLMLVISLGRSNLVCKFLPVVPDVNDPRLYAWGYRQPYNAAHMALDPVFPEDQPPSKLSDKLIIIDALGERGVNFNFVPAFLRINTYHNPPLAAGQPAGRFGGDVNFLRARALLYGADPSVSGSSFHPIDLTRDWEKSDECRYCAYYSRLLHPAFGYFVERVNAGKRAYLRPVPAVMDYFEQIARERGMQWPIKEERELRIELRLDKLATQIQGKQKEISALKRQSTKNAKGKARHLLLVKKSLEEEAKALTRRLRRLN